MDDAIKLGRLLKSVRSLAGLSQADVAAEAGLHPGTLSLAERGVRPLSPRSYVSVLTIIGRELGPDARSAA